MTTPHDDIARLIGMARGLNHCIRCDCQSCRSGYENHEHICTDGPGCVKPLETRLRKAIRVANEVASQLDSLSAENAELSADQNVKEQAIADMAHTIYGLQQERNALSARVKELEAEVERVKTDCAFTSNSYLGRALRAEQESDNYERLYHNETVERLRAEQERDEAYERLKPFAEASEDIEDNVSDRSDIWEAPCAMAITVKHLRAARDLAHRLVSGPEKEKS